MAQDKLRLLVSHYLLESELLQHELRGIMPILKDLVPADNPALRMMLERLDAVLARVEKAASGVD
jgi:hypothetical protein